MHRVLALLLLAGLALAAVAPTVNVPPIAPAIEGAPFALLADAGSGPVTWAISGTLPGGLLFNASTGLIYGTPAAASAGTYTVSLTASNAGGPGSASVQITVSAAGAATVANADLVDVSEGSDCSFALRTTGTATLITASGLPPGLNLNGDLISGTAPFGPAIYPVQVSADGGVTTTTMTVAVRAASIGAPTFAIPVQPLATIGAPFACFVTASGATAFACSNLPTGWSLASGTGILACTPSASDKTVNLKLSASAGPLIASSFMAVPVATTVAGNAIPLSPALIDATVGSGLGWRATAAVPATFLPSALPSGMVLDTASGILGGIPDTAGNTTLVMTATDLTVGTPISTTMAIQVRPQTTGAPVVDPLNPVPLTVGAPCAIAVTTTSGAAATGFSLVANADYAIDGTGLITGTPTAAGIAQLRVTATNAAGSAVTTLLAIVQAADGTGPLPKAPMLLLGSDGSAFSAALRATGATTSWSASGLPTGLNLANVAGIISGAPTQVGDANVPVSAIGATGSNASLAVIRVKAHLSGAPVFTNAGPWYLTAGQPCRFAPLAPGANAWSASGLPSGLSLADGIISGTATSVGVSDALVTAASGSSSTTTTAAIIVQAAITGAPSFSDSGTILGMVGTPLTASVVASGVTLGFTASPVIPGLSFDTISGTWTGIPTTVGTTTVLVTAANGSGTTSSTLVVRISGPSGSVSTPVSSLGGGGCGAGGAAGLLILVLGVFSLRRRR